MEGKLGDNDFWWKGAWGAWVLGMGQGDIVRKGGKDVDMEGRLGGNDFWWKGAQVLEVGQGDKDVCNEVGGLISKGVIRKIG